MFEIWPFQWCLVNLNIKWNLYIHSCDLSGPCRGWRQVETYLKDMGMAGLASVLAMARRREYRRKVDAATRCSGVCPHTWPDLCPHYGHLWRQFAPEVWIREGLKLIRICKERIMTSSMQNQLSGSNFENIPEEGINKMEDKKWNWMPAKMIGRYSELKRMKTKCEKIIENNEMSSEKTLKYYLLNHGLIQLP